jgi:hypothetical protein
MDSPWYGVGARELSNVRVSGGFAAILCAGVQLQVLIRLAAVHAISSTRLTFLYLTGWLSADRASVLSEGAL